MVSVQPSRASPEDIDVVITFHSSSQDPIYVSADATNWQPEAMDYNGEAYEHVITVPRSTRSIHYKFRIGDSMWVHDGTVSAEPDGFGGFNNRFDIPEVPYPADLGDFDEDTELESLAAVESVADTMSSADADEEKLNGFHHDEPELIDVDDVISDPDYPGMDENSLTHDQEKIRGADDNVIAAEKRFFRNLIFGLSTLGVVSAAVAWFWFA